MTDLTGLSLLAFKERCVDAENKSAELKRKLEVTMLHLDTTKEALRNAEGRCQAAERNAQKLEQQLETASDEHRLSVGAKICEIVQKEEEVRFSMRNI